MDEFAMPLPFPQRIVHVAVLAALVFTTAAASLKAAPQVKPQKTSAPKRSGYALLVGCTKFARSCRTWRDARQVRVYFVQL
jgi:hypothetical protein